MILFGLRWQLFVRNSCPLSSTESGEGTRCRILAI